VASTNLVSNRAQVSVINFNSGTNVYTTATTLQLFNNPNTDYVGFAPQALALDSANNKLFVLTSRDNGAGEAQVWVIDTSPVTPVLVDTVSGMGAGPRGTTPITFAGNPVNPTGLALITNANPALNRLYVTTTSNAAGNTGQVWVINTNIVATGTTGIVDQTPNGAVEPITIAGLPSAIAAKGSRLYVTHSNGTVSVIEILSGNTSSVTTFTIPTGASLAGLAIRPASGAIISDRLYVTGNLSAIGSNDNVYVVAIVPAI
jgi:hypothetical protein